VRGEDGQHLVAGLKRSAFGVSTTRFSSFATPLVARHVDRMQRCPPADHWDGLVDEIEGHARRVGDYHARQQQRCRLLNPVMSVKRGADEP